MAGFTVGFPAGSMVARGSDLAMPRSGIDELTLVAVVTGTPPGGVGEFLSESFTFLAPVPAVPVDVACFCPYGSRPCVRTLG